MTLWAVPLTPVYEAPVTSWASLVPDTSSNCKVPVVNGTTT